MTATYSSSTTVYTAVNCTVRVAHLTVWCWAVPGVGTGFVWSVNVALYTNVSSNGLRLSYISPSVTSLTGALTMQTYGGELVTLIGANFGPAGTPLTAGYGVSGNVYAAACTMTNPHTQLLCTTAPGVGYGLVWTLTVGGQTITVPGTPTQYAQPSVSDVQLISPTSTTGGVSLTVVGRNLGVPNAQIAPSLVYAPAAFPNLTYFATRCNATVNGSSLICLTAAGVGVNLAFQVTVGGQSSSWLPTSRAYQTPSVSSVLGGPFATIGNQLFTVQVRGSNLCVCLLRCTAHRARMRMRRETRSGPHRRARGHPST